MEDILDMAVEPYDRRYPVVGIDELPYQLVRERVVRERGQPLLVVRGRARSQPQRCQSQRPLAI